jgi:hypothetical protein
MLELWTLDSDLLLHSHISVLSFKTFPWVVLDMPTNYILQFTKRKISQNKKKYMLWVIELDKRIFHVHQELFKFIKCHNSVRIHVKATDLGKRPPIMSTTTCKKLQVNSFSNFKNLIWECNLSTLFEKDHNAVNRKRSIILSIFMLEVQALENDLHLRYQMSEGTSEKTYHNKTMHTFITDCLKDRKCPLWRWQIESFPRKSGEPYNKSSLW